MKVEDTRGTESVVEAGYPISFHEKEAKLLGQHLKNRHNVVLVGMRRVGISNFLRFFLNHSAIKEIYIGDERKHLFIPVDLNDLVELELGPFWTLTQKRILDAAVSADIAPETKKEIEALFLNSIQTQDVFLTIDNIRKSITLLTGEGLFPTLFFIVFDRIKDAVTDSFFNNLQGLQNATNNALSYVFTSFRSLDQLTPTVFTKPKLVSFSHTIYLAPLVEEDIRVIYRTDKVRYGVVLLPEIEQALLDFVDGYVRYMQLALVILSEKGESPPATKDALFELLQKDERLSLQSEELWESLTPAEQDTLQKVRIGAKISGADKEAPRYLWETGIVSAGGKVFSKLFERYLADREKKQKISSSSVELTKKEQLLFDVLKNTIDEICERETIAESVWPEVEEFGVSDWAIDRLVARVRNKLKAQGSTYEIQTVKTRGYKLLQKR